MFSVACGGGGKTDPGAFSTGGQVLTKVDGVPFLTDPHQGGGATRMRLLEVGWGRLVDVHDIEPDGSVDPVPILRDVLVSDNELGDGVETVLEIDPITHDARMVIHHVYHPAKTPADEGPFETVLKRLMSGLPPVLPKRDDGTSPPPVSLVPRNAALFLRFDDLLDDGSEALLALPETVLMQVGYPPNAHQPVRLRFDPNHGGLVDGEFHSTRVLVDFTVSAQEAIDSPVVVPLNVRGLPASFQGPQPNASLRLPTRVDLPNGRFRLLRNLAGRPLREDVPVDASTGELVRAWRTGNAGDTNGGYLLDLEQPRLVGTWDVTIDRARDDPAGPPGRAFVVDLTFDTACRDAIGREDLLQVGGSLFQASNIVAPSVDGSLEGVRLVARSSAPVSSLELLGQAQFLTPFRQIAVPAACWVTFSPPPLEPPGRGVSNEAEVTVRFSEPMDPETFGVFDSFRLLRGDLVGGGAASATDLTVCSLGLTPGLQQFRIVPSLPLNNTDVGEYTVEILGGLEGARDLSGLPLAPTFGRVSFQLNENEPRVLTGGIALRFSENEIQPLQFQDLRGQVNRVGGVLVPRPLMHNSASADRTTPLVNLMGSFAPGVVTPLSAWGSRLQALWRYCDFNWLVDDEDFYNLDVTGMSWVPIGGQVGSDFFREFEMRLSHSCCIPDETPTQTLQPKYPLSGLGDRDDPYAENILGDPRSPQKIVHPRGLGYRINPADLFLGSGGTPFMPFPMNRGTNNPVTFTWRDTAVLAVGGENSPGVPLNVEIGPPLFIDQGLASVAPPGKVPSFALPLLWEIRCYSTGNSLGLNPLEVALPVNGFSKPNFRAYSTGGFDTNGNTVTKNPDLELFPSGGYNPSSRPPGRPTVLVADNSFYLGRIEYVTRVSRAHTVWIDTGALAPQFADPVVEPREQPQGTSLLFEYRGADDFSVDSGDAPFDAQRLDPYGNYKNGEVMFHTDAQWSDDIQARNGSRFLQIRMSFLSAIDTGFSPSLDSLGIAFSQ